MEREGKFLRARWSSLPSALCRPRSAANLAFLYETCDALAMRARKLTLSAPSTPSSRLIASARLQPELGLILKQRLQAPSVELFVNAVARPKSGAGPLPRPGLQKCRAGRAPTPMSAQLEWFARSLVQRRLPGAR